MNEKHRPESTPIDVGYEGTLICFRCDISPSPGNRARCRQKGHLPLLKRAEGDIVWEYEHDCD